MKHMTYSELEAYCTWVSMELKKTRSLLAQRENDLAQARAALEKEKRQARGRYLDEKGQFSKTLYLDDLYSRQKKQLQEADRKIQLLRNALNNIIESKG